MLTLCFSDLNDIQARIRDNPDLKLPITKSCEQELRLLCENIDQEESEEPPCILLKKKLVYSIAVSPKHENELWAGLKFGKLLLYDLTKLEMQI